MPESTERMELMAGRLDLAHGPNGLDADRSNRSNRSNRADWRNGCCWDDVTERL